VRFVVDAQPPETLVEHLKQLEHDAVHVKHLPNGGDTSERWRTISSGRTR